MKKKKKKKVDLNLPLLDVVTLSKANKSRTYSIILVKYLVNDNGQVSHTIDNKERALERISGASSCNTINISGTMISTIKIK